MSISTDRSDSVRSSIEDLNDEQNFQIKLTREKFDENVIERKLVLFY